MSEEERVSYTFLQNGSGHRTQDSFAVPWIRTYTMLLLLSLNGIPVESASSIFLLGRGLRMRCFIVRFHGVERVYTYIRRDLGV
jgi:hypothetical protein